VFYKTVCSLDFEDARPAKRDVVGLEGPSHTTLPHQREV
jgi:hypothetical protein